MARKLSGIIIFIAVLWTIGVESSTHGPKQHQGNGRNHDRRQTRQNNHNRGILSWNLNSYRRSGVLEDLFIQNYKRMPLCTEIQNVPFDCPGCCETQASDETNGITIQCNKWIEVPVTDTPVRALILGEFEWSGRRKSQLEIEAYVDVAEVSQDAPTGNGRLASISQNIWSKKSNRKGYISRNIRNSNFQMSPPLQGEPEIEEHKNVSITVTSSIRCKEPRNHQIGGHCGDIRRVSTPDIVLEIYIRCRKSIFPRDFK